MRVVVGVDAGGSKTRALALDEAGSQVGYAETGGGSPAHSSDYLANVQSAIRSACASFDPGLVVAIVAGIAGLDRPKDHEWAEKCVDVEGMQARRKVVNDAEIALFGAFGGRPGIVSIQGEGSMVFGKIEDGSIVRNYDMFHYASASGVHIGFRLSQAVLRGVATLAEPGLESIVLNHWGAANLEDLRSLALSTWRDEHEATLRRAGELAPAVTAAADSGSLIASHICDAAATQICDGIQLVGPHFRASAVLVTLTGSCARSNAISSRVASILSVANEKSFHLVEPELSPVEGAARWALDLACY